MVHGKVDLSVQSESYIPVFSTQASVCKPIAGIFGCVLQPEAYLIKHCERHVTRAPQLVLPGPLDQPQPLLVRHACRSFMLLGNNRTWVHAAGGAA